MEHALKDPERLEALRRTGLMDSDTEDRFDRLTSLARKVLQVPVVLVSLVDGQRQFFKSQIGLGEPYCSQRETPLSHSFCQYVVRDKEPLVVNNAREHHILKTNGAIDDLGAVAYAGFPLKTARGCYLGSFCAIDTRPREWVDEELDILAGLADTVNTEIQLGFEIKEHRRAAQELEARVADLDRFTHIVSHDLREPLRAVSGFLSLLERELEPELDNNSRTYLQEAKNGAYRMNELLSAIARLARIGSGALSLRTIQLEDAVKPALRALSTTIEETGAEISLGALGQVQGDPPLLSQCFQNLVANAIKFRSGTPPRIHLESQTEKGQTEVLIQDNGIGIEPRGQERIFQPFQRLHARTEYPGTGIGLAICKRIVELHQGEIWVNSEGKNGSCFHFTLLSAD